MTPPDAADDAAGEPRCRICGTALGVPVVDLGMSPLCERFLSVAMLDLPEPIFPLQVHLCHQLRPGPAPRVRAAGRDLQRVLLLLVVLGVVGRAWPAVCRADDRRAALGPTSLVVEVASNDGYLLQHFRDRQVGILGIEPAQNIAAVANAEGIPTLARVLRRGARRRARRERAAGPI